MFRNRSSLAPSRLLVLLIWLVGASAWAQEGEGATAESDKNAPIRAGVVDPEETGELPKVPEDLARRVGLAFTNQDWAKARKLYAEILVLDPTNALALANMGIVNFQLEEYKTAKEYLEKALKKKPELVQARVTLGMTYYYTENLYLAVSHLTRALNDDPKSARTHLYLAVVAQQAGWTGAAEEELRKAIGIDPKYAEAHYNLALVYLEQKPPAIELARRHYQKALDLGAAPDKKIANQLK